jgi:hypothetical protein
MAKHVLSLEVIETLNPCILRIDDTSVYADSPEENCPGLPVTCPILNITPPGFNYSIEIGQDDIQSRFRVNLTACALDLQTESCGTEYRPLPDGIYIIKYSVSPNDQVFVEYNHLRTTQLRNKYEKVLCDLDISNCEPTADIEKKINTLKKIDIYIKAAKAKVEVCHEPKKGMELYKYAKKLLDGFTCSSCI